MKSRKYTKEKFEMLGRARHGQDAFDYSQVVYVNSLTPVKIKCNTCGRTFMQVPSEHLRGKGCIVCSQVGKNLKWTLDEFIDAAKKVHGDKYRYNSIENFRGLFHKISILCPKHGLFEQLPDAHLRGRGCPYCWNERRRTNVCGVGINDYDGNICPNGILLQSYKTWRGMITRCYDEKQLEKRPTYRDCNVCEEWLHFSNFKKWYDDPSNGYKEGYCLDKDILCPKNRKYSPDTCCFVPNEINIIIRSPYENKDLPTGVFSLNSGRYQASYNGIYLGSFDNVQEAYCAYCKNKEEDVHNRAIEYFRKGLITQKVYNALINYKVEQYSKEMII